MVADACAPRRSADRRAPVATRVGQKSGSAPPRPILAAARSRGGTYRSPRLDPAPAQPRWPVRVLPLRRVRHRFRERSRRGLADLLQRHAPAGFKGARADRTRPHGCRLRGRAQVDDRPARRAEQGDHEDPTAEESRRDEPRCRGLPLPRSRPRASQGGSRRFTEARDQPTGCVDAPRPGNRRVPRGRPRQRRRQQTTHLL